MSYWQDKIVIITGAASGIGRALAIDITKRGARVVATDIEVAAVRETAQLAGGRTEAMELDVSDAAAVAACCRDVAKRHGRLDVIFNNAGIGIYGEVYEIPPESWNRIIDINIRGVIHGIQGAYPIMVKQGHGQIINTASLAGLGAVPLLAPYCMTKHAVVGLTRSLRFEAELHGVRVNALCPAAIETPLLDRTENRGLPTLDWRPNIRRFLGQLGGPPYPLDRFIKEALAAIERNEGVIVLPRRAKIAQQLGVFLPALVDWITRRAVAQERADRLKP